MQQRCGHDSNSFEDEISGLRKLDVHIQGYPDAGANPSGAPLD
jgi:hypothetical protein